MTATDITIDKVTDNGNNILLIEGHDAKESYSTSNGRLTDMPVADPVDDPTNILYFQNTLFASLPPQPVVIYENQA